MKRRWSEIRLHDGSDNPPVTEGLVRFNMMDDRGSYVANLWPGAWEGRMAYQVELPPPEPAEIWVLRRGKRFSAFLFGSRSQAENYNTSQDNPDEWEVVRFVEALK